MHTARGALQIARARDRNPQPSELAALRRTMVLSPPGQALCTYISVGNLSVPLQHLLMHGELVRGFFAC